MLTLPPSVKDITGRKFGSWLCVSYAAKGYWLCHCDCSVERLVFGADLRRGKSTGCGCIADKKFAEKLIKHGGARRGKELPEYWVWKSMMGRCYIPKITHYSYYGGKGITVVERWHSFINFFDDMGKRPTPLHTIDRIDGNAAYSPENCRWATRGEQVRNRMSTHWITLNGETKCLTDWARQYNIKPATLASRLTNGWDIIKALNTKVQIKHYTNKP